ncbi:hypothetical protein EJB05_07492 [Eragrostis curvula]|uniref:Uncharacterized protein n=1 Tax=Eragrostis curvula TaxID=38414 RepID=A0A5J9WIW9_9POAL|nr:hypothetical protein EJB05_07492 [Eragrostis curvula]
MDLRRRAVYAASKRRHQVLSFSRWTPPSSPAVSLTSAPKGILLAANVGCLATSQSPPPPPALLLPDGSQTTSPLHHGAQPLTLRASSSADLQGQFVCHSENARVNSLRLPHHYGGLGGMGAVV